MSATWTTIIALIAANALIRASGPVILGGRQLPERPMAVIALLAPALLAALVITETFADESSLVLDERVVGVAAAGFVLTRTDSVLWAIAAATTVAAAVRALS